VSGPYTGTNRKEKCYFDCNRTTIILRSDCDRSRYWIMKHCKLRSSQCHVCIKTSDCQRLPCMNELSLLIISMRGSHDDFDDEEEEQHESEEDEFPGKITHEGNKI